MATLSFDNTHKRAVGDVTFTSQKRVCLAPAWARTNSFAARSVSSSSSSDDDSEDEVGYLNKQKRARKRASSMRRVSTGFNDSLLNTAVSQYSDVDEDDLNGNKVQEIGKEEEKIPSIPTEKENFRTHRESLAGLSSDSKNKIRRTVDCDKVARNRCFDYLVSAIDEVWARYCDATSYAEDEVYNTDVSYQPATPASIDTSEDEDDDEDEGYKSASTNITEYESDVDGKRVSGQPGSLRLQQLKDRLLKAKYYLQDFLESNDLDEATAFWKRWDLIKYATIELVEDDDDDEVIESTTEDLEKGRLIGSY